MTKKDYKAIADLIANIYNQTINEKEHNVLEMIREGLIQIFQADNERFNAKKFNEYLEKATMS